MKTWTCRLCGRVNPGKQLQCSCGYRRKLARLAFLIPLILVACAKPPQDPDAVQAQTTCLIPPYVLDSDFQDTQMDHVFDKDLAAAAFSGAVPAGESRVIDVDYGCVHHFQSFQQRNMITNQWAFGRVTVYRSQTRTGPWELVTSFTEADATEDVGFNWFFWTETESRYIRYQYTNEAATDTEFIVSDIETGSYYVRP